MTSDIPSKRYPNKITLALLYNPLCKNDKRYFIGAPIKKATLELRPEDLYLADWLQIRKHQNGTKKSHVIFTNREELFKIAGLDGIKHVGMANKRLLEKLRRIQDKGGIVSFPTKVTFPFRIKVR